MDGLRKRGESWIIDKIVHGERIYETLGKITEREAEKIASQRFAQAMQGEYFPTSKLRKYTVSDCLSDYWVEHLQFKKYGQTFKYLLTTIDNRLGRALVASLKKSDIEAYKRLRREDTNKRGEAISWRTVEAELKLLSAAINHAVDNERHPANKISRFCRVPKETRIPVVLDNGTGSGDDIAKILAAAPVQFLPLIRVIAGTGMRPSEVFAMRSSWIKQLTTDRWAIEIPADSEKTATARLVPVSADLRPILSRAIEFSKQGGLLFPTRSGKPRKHFGTQWGRIATQAGLGRELTLYALRRTRISIWDAIDSEACRVAVGHAARDVHSRNYVRVGIDRLFRLVESDYLRDICVDESRKTGELSKKRVLMH